MPVSRRRVHFKEEPNYNAEFFMALTLAFWLVELKLVTTFMWCFMLKESLQHKKLIPFIFSIFYFLACINYDFYTYYVQISNINETST